MTSLNLNFQNRRKKLLSKCKGVELSVQTLKTGITGSRCYRFELVRVAKKPVFSREISLLSKQQRYISYILMEWGKVILVEVSIPTESSSVSVSVCPCVCYVLWSQWTRSVWNLGYKWLYSWIEGTLLSDIGLVRIFNWVFQLWTKSHWLPPYMLWLKNSR